MIFSSKFKDLIEFGTEAPVLVGRESLAFLRGYLQGVDLHKLDALYPQTTSGCHGPKARLESIRQDLSKIAKRNGRDWRDARLLWIDPERLEAGAAPAMSLDEFRWERDPDSFYSEAELIELYQDEVGTATVDERRRARNDRIRRRQLAMISSLEQLLPAPPSRADNLSIWLPQKMAATFCAVGIVSVDDLAKHISSAGHTWWKKMPRIGRKRASLIERWLIDLKVAEGPIQLKSPQLLQHRSPTAGLISPLETFIPPAEILAEVEFVKQWLTDYAVHASPNTFRTYSRSLERFVLFYAFAAPAHSSLFSELLFNDFRDFLAALGRTAPADWTYGPKQTEWIGPRHAERNTMAWRPFAGPLSRSAQSTTSDAVSACLTRMRTNYSGEMFGQSGQRN